MSEFIVGARGHDFGRRSVEEPLSSIKCRVPPAPSWPTPRPWRRQSYADGLELVAATNAAVQKSGVSTAVDGTHAELS